MRMLRAVFAIGLASAVVAGAAIDVERVEAVVTADGESIIPGANPKMDSTASDAAVQAPKPVEQHDAHERSRSSLIDPTAGTTGDTATKSHVSLVVFQKELDVLHSMIELQDRKLRALEKMRAALAEDADAGEHALGMNRRYRVLQASREELEEAVDRKLDVIAAQVATAAATSQFDSLFIDRAAVELDGEAVDIKMGKIRNLPTHEIVTVGLRSGQIRFLLSSGEELLRLDTQLEEITGIQLDTASDPPLLAVLAASGEPRVRTFALDIKLDGRDSQPEVSTNSAAKPVASASISLSVLELPALAAVAAPASAIAIARSSRRSLLSVAHTDAVIRFYALNGSLVHDVPVAAAGISTMVTHRHFVAFSNGSSVVVFPLTRHKKPDFTACHGSPAAVVSIAFDAIHADFIYAGTVDGEVLVFSLAGNSESGVSCRLVHRSIVTRHQRLDVVAIKGYVAAVSSTQLAVFNISRTDATVALGRVCSKLLDGRSGRFASRLAVAENGQATVFGLLASSQAGVTSLLLLQSLLPGEASAGDSSVVWRGATFVGMIAIAVLTAQYCLRRQHNPASGDGNLEGEDWRALLEKHRRPASGLDRASSSMDRMRPTRQTNRTASSEQYMGDPTMFNATVEAFAKSSRRKQRAAVGDATEDPELRHRIAEARRETLECSFDDEDDGY